MMCGCGSTDNDLVIYVQWNLSNLDTNGAEGILHFSGVSSLQSLQEWSWGGEVSSEEFHCIIFPTSLSHSISTVTTPSVI